MKMDCKKNITLVYGIFVGFFTRKLPWDASRNFLAPYSNIRVRSHQATLILETTVLIVVLLQTFW